MIRVSGIKVKLNETLENKIIKKLNVKKEEIKNIKINKKSLDARDKDNIHYVYEVDLDIVNENKLLKNHKDIKLTPKEVYKFPKKTNHNSKVFIIGSGPAGLFCAYLLAENGYSPIIIERGEKVEDRVKTVETFWNKNIINKNSNVQFGEGGAGTFSDGKLNTLVKDKKYRMKKVFEIFVKHGAPEEIMYLKNPHIGTDKLRRIIPNIRNQIIKMGGEFKYNTTLTDLIIENGKIKQIVLNNKETLDCNTLVLAIGHSARDTFKMLYKKHLEITSKPFAVGLRLQHPQSFINKAQYGNVDLPPASYKLTYNTKDRGVYTFCMCPGGFVVNSSSEENTIVTNGMSNYQRDEKNANSAIIVTVSNKDFGKNPLDGMYFQKQIEEKAYTLGNGKIPVQLYKDYKENNLSKEFKTIKPVFKGSYNFSNINDIFPDYINKALKEGIDYFNTKIKGFNSDDVILAAPETRTSSPIRILRDDNYQSNIKGIYPCGEGAGYAGGITTSAMDGIKIAEAIATKPNIISD